MSAEQRDDSLRNIPSQLQPPWSQLSFGRATEFLRCPATSVLTRLRFSCGSTLHLPLWESTVTTNVPMDGNYPRGWRDWQRAEWDQRLKGLQRGKKPCQRSKNKKTCCKECIGHQHGPKWDPHPALNYACSLTPQPWGRQGQVRHEAHPAAGFALRYLMPGPAMLGTDPVKHTALRLALDTEANTTCDRVIRASA